MNKMADTVVRKNNDAEKEIEKRVMLYQSEKEQKDFREDERRKNQIKKKNDEIKKTLAL
jgi:hypothetical protein